MANRTFYPAVSNGLNKVYLEFELLGAGAAALTIPVTGGGSTWVASVVRSAVGVFVVTMKDSFNRCFVKTADIDDTLNDGAYASAGSLANEATALPLVFTLYTRTSAGVAADPAVGRRIGMQMALRNGLPNQGG